MRSEEGMAFPGSFLCLAAARAGPIPFGEGQERGALDGGDGALGAGVEFADGLDGVAEELDAHGALRFRGENIDDAAADGKMSGKLDHFGARVADAREMGDQFFVRNFGVFSEGACEG